MFQEVAALQDEARLEFHKQSQYLTSLDTLIRGGSHVLVDANMNLRSLIALDFSQTGIYWKKKKLYSVYYKTLTFRFPSGSIKQPSIFGLFCNYINIYLYHML